jgi:MinD superfamily P-loop ATPase
MFRKKQAPIIGLISNQGMRNGLPQYDLTDEDIERFATEKGIPFITAIPHDDNLTPYFDRVADFVINCQPIVLPQKVIDETEAIRTIRGITKLIDLMEALR